MCARIAHMLFFDGQGSTTRNGIRQRWTNFERGAANNSGGTFYDTKTSGLYQLGWVFYGGGAAKEIGEEKMSISVGRVMTCVLGMIVQREREIKNFVKTPYYKIAGEFGSQESSFKAEWKVTEKSTMWESTKLYNEAGFRKEEEAKQFIASLKDKKAVVVEVKKSKTKENAPLLFNLAELQNEATKRFKIKPDETLEIVQNLYEKKLVTYPRTDARVK